MKDRKQVIDHIASQKFDVCVIGGGASGSACALEGQLRGLNTVILEAGDFASGSSTASTKMAHGGVRYLQEAVDDLDIHQYHLVETALRERAQMLHNAPHRRAWWSSWFRAFRKELGWNEEKESEAVEQYVAQVNHMLTTAGLEPVAVATGLVAGRR